jgi:hypothetical protein
VPTQVARDDFGKDAGGAAGIEQESHQTQGIFFCKLPNGDLESRRFLFAEPGLQLISHGVGRAVLDNGCFEAL